ncbi:MAG TPA: hypothetical protein VMV59_10455 [Candidatus Dormibacteraeota bacterium]|nr:hypothetical protein [Candidatus Dormibacteraeota bacterium]
MDGIETTQTAGGAGLLGVPAFDFFVWALDTYARGDLLMSLHEHLPPLLLNPGVGFLCLCGGLGFLYMAHKRQVASLRKQSTKRVVDYSGTEVQSATKPNWIMPVIAVFLLALIATPILALGYSLAYTGNPPKSSPAPNPPSFAYEKTPNALKKTGRQHLVIRNILTATAPNGIANTAPNLGTQTVNNFVPIPRTLLAGQIEELSAVGSALPDGQTIDTWSDNTSEAVSYAKSIHNALKSAGTKLKPGPQIAMIPISRDSSDPHDSVVCILDKEQPTYPSAFKIANILAKNDPGKVEFDPCPATGMAGNEIRIYIVAQH